MGFWTKAVTIYTCKKAGRYCQNYDWCDKSSFVQLDQIKIYQLYEIILVYFGFVSCQD